MPFTPTASYFICINEVLTFYRVLYNITKICYESCLEQDYMYVPEKGGKLSFLLSIININIFTQQTVIKKIE